MDGGDVTVWGFVVRMSGLTFDPVTFNSLF